MSFDEDIALDADGKGAIADGWMTARGPHGGYVMAILANAMERAAGRGPRSLTVHFLRPPAIGPVQAHATVERQGRSMTTVTGRLEQGGKPVALGIAAYAAAYDAPDVGEVPMPDVPPPSAGQEPLPGAPPFTHQMIMQPRFGAARLETFQHVLHCGPSRLRRRLRAAFAGARRRSICPDRRGFPRRSTEPRCRQGKSR